MSYENPLDFIRSLNKKKEEEPGNLAAETPANNQEMIDQEQAELEEQKLVLVVEVEKIKNRLAEIKGTREEMIAQYHEAIAEAKKNPETLDYVRKNFSDIFKDGKEKWQTLRDELDLSKESEKDKTNKIQSTDQRLEEIMPMTSQGKDRLEQEKKEQEQREWFHKYKLEKQQKEVRTLTENIENAKSQKLEYNDILDQRVEYTRENYMSGEAKIISDDAKKFTTLWREFPVHPFVLASGGRDYMVEELKKKRYSDQDIENYKNKRENLKKIENNIFSSLQKVKPRYSQIGFARSNDISYPSFPFISIGHGNHYFDTSLLGKQMTLGELFDKEIEIKTNKLQEAKAELEKIEKEV